jgi:hypothetical protein
MQNTRIIYRNLWKVGSILANTTESPQFPAVNTEDDDTTLFFRTAPGSPTGTAYISRDLGVATQYDYVSLLGHRISAGSTIVLTGADNSAFTTNAVTDSITWASGKMRLYLSAARTKRYVKIDVTDASNPDGYCQIGTVVLGKYADLAVTVRQGYADGYEDYTLTEYSPSRNLFITQDAPTFRRFSVEFPKLADAGKASIIDLLQNNGKHLAFEICFDYTAANTSTYWVTLVEYEHPRNVASVKWDWTATVEEHA